MKSLYEKIIAIYPELTVADFMPPTGSIVLQNDTGNVGDDYIREWNHPTLLRPTDEQLAAVD